jgi:hypothetical protein
MPNRYAFWRPWRKFLKIRDTDGGGFEPPVPFGTHALQACTINHSVTHPSVVLVIVLLLVLECNRLRSRV